MSDQLEIGKLVLAFMVLINPFSALSLYLSLTQHYDPHARSKVAQFSAISVWVTIVIFTFVGNLLLKALGISLGAFQVGGGILVFLIAVSMVSSGNNVAKPQISTEKGDGKLTVTPHKTPDVGAIAVVPLAIPMMIGPGGISTVIIYSAQAHSYRDYAAIIITGTIVSLICYFSLRVAAKMSALLGETGLAVLNRVMGILLAAVSVEIVVAGLRALFPQLAN